MDSYKCNMLDVMRAGHRRVGGACGNSAYSVFSCGSSKRCKTIVIVESLLAVYCHRKMFSSYNSMVAEGALSLLFLILHFLP